MRLGGGKVLSEIKKAHVQYYKWKILIFQFSDFACVAMFRGNRQIALKLRSVGRTKI